MSERLAFIQACLDRREHISAICARFAISEKTGHKWLARFRTAGLEGLQDRGHAPHHHRFHVDAAVAARIITLRRRHPLYGAAKLRDWLVQREPATRWPAASTIGELLQRAGLIHSRRRARKQDAGASVPGPLRSAQDANAVWTADFKGEFRLGSGAYCYPLTVLDLHSHYLLGCRALLTTAIAPTRQCFAHLFAEYGLPEVLRTDNGVPFAQANALGRLGALAYWWIRLGIRPEHIRPARPAENGAHERFHKTLKAHTTPPTHPAAPSLRAQQQRFDRFQQEYNTERPHESTVAHRPPSATYVASPRPYPAKLPPLYYPDAIAVRLVDCGGTIKWRNQPLFLSTNLCGDYVGIFPTETDAVCIRYSALALGVFDPDTRRFVADLHWWG
jgi:transposase InsO family protein